MTKPLPEDFSSIAEKASRLQRTKTYKMQNPEGSQLRACLSHAAGRAVRPWSVAPAHHQSGLRRALALQFDGFEDAAAQN